MKRNAKCSCENLQIELSGDPHLVLACNCLNCQKRTGSVFGVSAYFKHEQVEAKRGSYSLFTDISDDGHKITRAFCPSCGSTVFWEAEFLPQSIGVSVGCFADPNFPQPKYAVWKQSKHEWVEFPEHWRTSETQQFD